jgi:PAS domain S-box-containing protein
VNYRSLVELAPDPTYLLDPDGKFLFSNLAGLELLRCTAEEVVSKSITDTYQPEATLNVKDDAGHLHPSSRARQASRASKVVGMIRPKERVFSVYRDGEEVSV